MRLSNIPALRRIALLAGFAMLPLGCTVSSDDTYVPVDAGRRDAASRDAQSTTPTDAGARECVAESTIGMACTGPGECDDGCFCNGIELCVEGVCVHRDQPCVDDIECTQATCDEETDSCNVVGDDSLCDDGDLCNGTETCVPGIGCRAGLRLSCNDGDPCTVGACVPDVGCVFTLRDLDGDGYADERCGGDDCNDDPLVGASVSPASTEICGNGLDDDCDGLTDYRETSCTAVNDTCDTAEMLPGPGTYVRTTRGARSDHPIGCQPTGVDTVFRFRLESAADVQATLMVEGTAGSVAIRPAASCETGPDAYCTNNSTLARNLPAGEYVAIVRTATGATFSLTLDRMPATPLRATDVCNADTFTITASGTYTGFFSDVNDDYRLSCHTGTTAWKDVAYRLVITEPRDVRLRASTNATTTTSAYLALMRDCTSPTTGIACVQRSGTAEIFRRALEPGTYYVLIESSSTAATTWSLTAELTPAAPRTEGDACSTELDITNTTVSIPLNGLELDYGMTCGGNTSAHRDASFSFTNTELTDVILTTEAAGSVHFVSLSGECGNLGSELVCTSGTPRVVQRFLRVEPGTHHVTVSSGQSSGMMTVSARLEPPTFPPENDGCAGATDLVDAVPATANLLAASDDVLSCGASGSPDAMHRLVLTEPHNVTLVARRTDGSGEPIAIGLRTDCSTPSSDLECATGAPALLNETLEPGTYYVVVESARGVVGPYSLVAYLADP